ncbi:hypothetical protein K431DRAFT_21928 [Polychaeton citri CBS 116435]|uniref:Uncharacterized protein n=1 Tax=Polychaeton citri CBS 116435 TaxID=1314669 RepID=A0A9P4QCK4_9PEZI|nr:hypothetical protein K431DRAFT_21928 [Polychaeton citri CBS 116435]
MMSSPLPSAKKTYWSHAPRCRFSYTTVFVSPTFCPARCLAYLGRVDCTVLHHHTAVLLATSSRQVGRTHLSNNNDGSMTHLPSTLTPVCAEAFDANRAAVDGLPRHASDSDPSKLAYDQSCDSADKYGPGLSLAVGEARDRTRARQPESKSLN